MSSSLKPYQPRQFPMMGNLSRYLTEEFSSISTSIASVLDVFKGKTAPQTYTVATLPSAAAAGAGARAFVTDATATTFASAVVGGGTNKVPVYTNGTTWYIG